MLPILGFETVDVSGSADRYAEEKPAALANGSEAAGTLTTAGPG